MVTSSEVLTTQLARTRFRPGFDVTQVDEALDRIIATLRSYEAAQTDPASVKDPITQQDVDTLTFDETRFRDGYQKDDVTALLRKISATLKEYEQLPRSN